MSTYQIFEQTIYPSNDTDLEKPKTFAVWVTNGLIQYVIDGEIQHDIENINEFLIEAAKHINSGNDSNVGNFSVSGANNIIDDDSLENYEPDSGVVLDRGGDAPAISIQDEGTEVKFSGENINSNFRIDFGTGGTAEAEALTFKNFADDLLGAAQTTKLATFNPDLDGLQTVKVSQRDDDIRKVQFKDSGDTRDDSWADAFIDQLGEELGGTKLRDGKVSETNYTANQLNFKDATTVNLGQNGVGGNEDWEFTSEADAQEFFDAIKAAFADGDRRDIINSAIESLAEDLGGTQTKNGNVSTNYEARQIKLFGEDLSSVNLGSHRVGGKETYDFADQATAQKFIDAVRDLVGVEGTAGKLVDEFIFDVSGRGTDGTETFVGKDAFIEYLGDDIYGGTLIRDGAVSESFNGDSKETVFEGGVDVQLGPSGVGGKEIWRFEDQESADAFAAALETFML